MDKLILITNKLQQYNNTYKLTDLDLPQIVVVGSQSSGKSSVMERIIGHDILPKASKVATRCPIILQLIHKEMNPQDLIDGQFTDDKTLFHGAEDIAEQLQFRNNNIGQTSEGVSDNPIFLKLYSSTHPTLTLIDLPGIIKNDGELPPGSTSKIENLSAKYAESPNAIILAVSAANVDLANSDSIAIAKRYDPKGHRTINVLTKIDIMDRGTTVKEILDNRLLHDSLGTICVVNRSQESVTNKKQLDITNEEERSFFENRQSDIVGMNGIDVLKDMLVNKLIGEILKNIQRMEDVISTRIDDLKDVVRNRESQDKDVIIHDNISIFVLEYKNLITGDRNDYSIEIEGGAIISELLYNKFERTMKECSVKCFSREKAMSILKNTCGNKRMSYSIDKTFVSLIRSEIEQFLQPSLKCNSDVKLILKGFISKIIEEYNIKKYLNLALKIQKEMESFIEIKFTITQGIIRNIIRCEKEDVFTLTPNSSLYESLKSKIDLKLNEAKENLLGGVIDSVAKCAQLVMPPQIRYALVLADKVGALDCFKDGVPNLTRNEEETKAIEDFMNENAEIVKTISDEWKKCLHGEALNKNLDVMALEQMVQEYFEIVRRNVICNVQKWIQTIFIKDLLDEMDKSALHCIRKDENTNDLLNIDEEEERIFQVKTEELKELIEIYEELRTLKRQKLKSNLNLF